MIIPQIKICGLTKPQDAILLGKYQVDYAGIVMYYKQSKRYNSVKNARKIIQYLDSNIQKVAVTVSPALEQIRIIEELGFDLLQVHGILSEEVLTQSKLPILKANNIADDAHMQLYAKDKKVIGYVLDGRQPGSGKTFDWSLMKAFERGSKILMLAGGLTAANVQAGIKALSPDVVDVSSGVECCDGKDEEKIKEFVRKVRTYE